MDPASELSSEEEIAVKEFRNRLKDALPKFKNDFLRHDLSLIRFLRARDLNLDKAETMIRANVEWRLENRVDTILEEQHLHLFTSEYPFKLHGPDKDGCLGVIADLGFYDFRKSGPDKDRALRYFILLFESVGEIGRRWSTASKFCFQIVVTLDLKDFSLYRMMSRDAMVFIRDLIKIFDSHYPEAFKAAHMVNAPKLFEICWNWLKPLLAARTASKVHIYSSDTNRWRSVLRNSFDLDKLPSYFGGSVTTWPNYKFEDGFDVYQELRGTPPDGASQTVSIPARANHCVNIDVKEKNSKLLWQFKTEESDVGFQVSFNENQVILVENCRLDSHVATQLGHIACKEPGKYTLIFDNSYSTFKSKELTYASWTEPC